MGTESENKSGRQGEGTPVQHQHIPPASKKLINNLREIVNKSCTDSEIYAVLLECNMDPNDAVHTLLSQDTFHEVKSKRERRKEMKETQEPKARANSNGYRIVKVGGDYNVGQVSSQTGYNDNDKAAYRRENSSISSVPSSSLVYRVKTTNEQHSAYSDSLSADCRRQTLGSDEILSTSAQTSTATPNTLSGVTSISGQVTMADIVRMGKPQNKGSQTALEAYHTPQDSDSQYEPFHYSSSSQLEVLNDLQSLHSSYESKTIHEPDAMPCQHNFAEWPGLEQKTVVSRSSTLNKSLSSGIEYVDGAKLPEECQSEVQVSDINDAVKNFSFNGFESSSFSRSNELNDVEGVVHYDDNRLQDIDSYDIHRSNCGNLEAISASLLSSANVTASSNDEALSTAMDFQKLSLGKEEAAVPSSEDDCTVVFPNSMQALAAGCSHLSFGTYKAGVATATSVPLASNFLNNNFEEGSAEADGASAANMDARNSGFVDKFLHDGPHGLAADFRATHFSQELRSSEIPIVNHAHDYVIPSSVHDTNLKKVQELGSLNPVATNPYARNLPFLHRELQASSVPTSIDLLASVAQSLRDSNLVDSSLLGTQLLASRYSSAMPSSVHPAVSVAEDLNSSALSLPMALSSPLANASHAMGPVLPKHVSRPSYSQPSLSLQDELSNLTGYSSMPQKYAHNSPALQQFNQDNMVFHGSTVSMKQNVAQYRAGAFRSSMLQSDANVFPFEDFASSNNLSAQFLHDTSSTHSRPAVVYDDIMRSQYKEGNNLTLLQQNGTSSMWDYGTSARTSSNVLDNRNYSLSGQSQLLSRYPQTQQFAQNYDIPAYTHHYHSEAGIIRDQQLQDLGDLAYSSSQGQPSKQVQQMWQQRY